MTKISDVLVNNGIFYYLNMVSPEKYAEFFNPNEVVELDTLYLGNHGSRTTSPYLDMLAATTDGVLNNTSGSQVASMIWAMNYKNWERLKYVVDNAEHYDVTYHVTSSDTTTTDLDRTETDNENTTESVYGFDSVEAQPSNTESAARTKTRNTDTVVTKEHEQIGSVGYFSQAQLIKGEYQVEKYHFLYTVFDDITDVLGLDVFE